eukprot:364564-Chlamydomonas_euryale.AAC.5
MCGSCTLQRPSGPARAPSNLARSGRSTAQPCDKGLIRCGCGFQTRLTEQPWLSRCNGPSRTAARACRCRMYAQKVLQCQPGTAHIVGRVPLRLPRTRAYDMVLPVHF